MLRVRPLLVGIVGWVASATASVAVGLLALSLVDTELTTGPTAPPVAEPLGQPVTQSPVAGTPDEPVASATPAVTTSRAGAPPVRLDSAGGYVVARCGTAGAYLVYWSPAPGYRAHDVTRGPAPTARLVFEGEGREVKMAVTCVAGEPRASVEEEDEHDEDGP